MPLWESDAIAEGEVFEPRGQHDRHSSSRLGEQVPPGLVPAPHADVHARLVDTRVPGSRNRVGVRSPIFVRDEGCSRNSTVEPGCFDDIRHPGARSWFRTGVADLLTMSAEYLDLLDRYGVGWVELRTDRPGRTTYEDDVQIVAVPLAYPADWPFAPAVSTGVAARRC
ncbi:hypothetical protein [Curtobacterium sp. KT1]|uniref:hypothetical protein n=1 Tax=Curtobacterium sp. KT1 TaxID=3372858 RepID=UPI0037BED608